MRPPARSLVCRWVTTTCSACENRTAGAGAVRVLRCSMRPRPRSTVRYARLDIAELLDRCAAVEAAPPAKLAGGVPAAANAIRRLDVDTDGFVLVDDHRPPSA